jgi:hypothetical protein
MNRHATAVWDVIIWAVILLVVAIVLILAFNNLFGKEVGSIGNELLTTGDYDGDNIADRFDQCVCITGETNSGCPVGKTVKSKAERFEECPQAICKTWGLSEKEMETYCKE